MTTSGGDLLFYDYSKDLLLTHCFVNNNVITSMNYWSDGSTAVFSTGDVFGYVTVFISYNIKENGLFCSAAYIQNRNVPEFSTIDVSVLLQNPSENFMCYKLRLRRLPSAADRRRLCCSPLCPSHQTNLPLPPSSRATSSPRFSRVWITPS